MCDCTVKILFIPWNLYQLKNSLVDLNCLAEELIQDLCLQKYAFQCKLLVILPMLWMRHITMKIVLTLYFWCMVLWMERSLFDHLSYFKHLLPCADLTMNWSQRRSFWKIQHEEGWVSLLLHSCHWQCFLHVFVFFSFSLHCKRLFWRKLKAGFVSDVWINIRQNYFYRYISGFIEDSQCM